MLLASKRRRDFAAILLAALLCQTLLGVAGADESSRAAFLAGVNISGAELNGGRPGARPNFDYVYPTEGEIAWAASHHMTVIRLPVEWSRLQPSLGGGIDEAEWNRVVAVIRMARSHDIRVILDLHDYGAWRGRAIGGVDLPDAVFADTWGRIAALARHQPELILGLMNEPHLQSAPQWERSAQAALDAIRRAGARNLVLVPGANWDGAHSWTAGGTASNAAAMDHFVDPAGAPVAFEFHQYFDHDFSGTKPDCLAPAAAIRTLEPATAWLAAGHRQGFLGEFATAGTPACLDTLDAVLTYLHAHPAQWTGWTYWAAGAWWRNYMFSVEPSHGAEHPQMAVLSRHLP